MEEKSSDDLGVHAYIRFKYDKRSTYSGEVREFRKSTLSCILRGRLATLSFGKPRGERLTLYLDVDALEYILLRYVRTVSDSDDKAIMRKTDRALKRLRDELIRRATKRSLATKAQLRGRSGLAPRAG
jgi:hypothetical protein